MNQGIALAMSLGALAGMLAWIFWPRQVQGTRINAVAGVRG